jgi:hypothetical protein
VSETDDEVERDAQRGPGRLIIGSPESDSRVKGAIALYIRVYAREGFEQACEQFHAVLADALKNQKDRPIVIYGDIDGHRDRRGFLDVDMLDFQCIAYAMARKCASHISMPSIEVHPDALPDKPSTEISITDRPYFEGNPAPEGVELVNPLDEVDPEIRAFFRQQQRIYEYNRRRK